MVVRMFVNAVICSKIKREAVSKVNSFVNSSACPPHKCFGRREVEKSILFYSTHFDYLPALVLRQAGAQCDIQIKLTFDTASARNYHSQFEYWSLYYFNFSLSA